MEIGTRWTRGLSLTAALAAASLAAAIARPLSDGALITLAVVGLVGLAFATGPTKARRRD